jgi:hypothetical protein
MSAGNVGDPDFMPDHDSVILLCPFFMIFHTGTVSGLASYQIRLAGYPAEYRILKIAGYPANWNI